MDALMAEKLAIRETVENWVLWRDAGDWERFKTVWHPEGWMNATWFQGPAQRFIEVSREGWDKGVVGQNVGSRIELVIPASLAYKDQPPAGSNIPPNASLVFVIDILDAGVGSPDAG